VSPNRPSGRRCRAHGARRPQRGRPGATSPSADRFDAGAGLSRRGSVGVGFGMEGVSGDVAAVLVPVARLPPARRHLARGPELPSTHRRK
jgi:hypothetical protein